LDEINNINKKPIILAIIQLGLAKFVGQVLQATWAQSWGPAFHQTFYVARIKLKLPAQKIPEEYILSIVLPSTNDSEYTTTFFSRVWVKDEHKGTLI